MTLEAILTIAETHPLQVLLLGTIVFHGVREAVSLVLERARARRLDSGRRPLGALVSLVAPADGLGLSAADDPRPTAAGSTRRPLVM